MPSQLPEHAVASLIKQCFVTPRCQAPRIHRRTCSSSSTSPYHRVRAVTSCNKALRVERQHRCHYTQGRAADDNEYSHEINSLGLSSAQREDFQTSFPAKQQKRSYSKGNQPQGTRRIAVLGGGITGLASAHYLTRELPNAQITIYERGDKLGGWLKSKYVNIGNGKILFEQGPRTLRPNTPSAMATIEMIQDLGLENELLFSSKTSEAAINRFVYYPDHLVRMPGPFQSLYNISWSFLTEPVFKGIFSGVLLEITRDPRPASLEDESVASFLQRRLGNPHIGNNIVSAVLHGIYAGDIYQLSAKSLLPRLWEQERQFESIAAAVAHGLRNNAIFATKKDLDLLNEMSRKIDSTLSEQMKMASVYTFKEGIGALSKALETSLKANPNVQFKTGHKVTAVEYDAENNGIKIKTASNQPLEKYTKAISTISGRTLSTLTSSLPSLATMYAVTVMVVNLYYPDPNLLPERGFGYLIPRSIPFEQNPECALGVVFDSDAVQGQDTVPGTKVTVMLGGHWWDGFSSYPDEEEGAAMAKSVLYRHLKVDAEPEAVNVGLHRECIPQYVVGHERRMRTAKNELMDGFKSKLKVAGNSYTGVGLNDCVRAARDVAMGIKRGEEVTGLEGFVE